MGNEDWDLIDPRVIKAFKDTYGELLGNIVYTAAPPDRGSYRSYTSYPRSSGGRLAAAMSASDKIWNEPQTKLSEVSASEFTRLVKVALAEKGFTTNEYLIGAETVTSPVSDEVQFNVRMAQRDPAGGSVATSAWVTASRTRGRANLPTTNPSRLIEYLVDTIVAKAKDPSAYKPRYQVHAAQCDECDDLAVRDKISVDGVEYAVVKLFFEQAESVVITVAKINDDDPAPAPFGEVKFFRSK